MERIVPRQRRKYPLPGKDIDDGSGRPIEGIFEDPSFDATRQDIEEWLEFLRQIPNPGVTVLGAIQDAEKRLARMDGITGGATRRTSEA